MWIDKDREVVNSNVYCIPERLREIDPDYFVIRNHRKRRFEIHNKGQIGNTFSLIVPFDELDCRTIDRVRETRIERIDEIIKQMDKENMELEISREREARNKGQAITKEIHKYARKHEHRNTIPEEAINNL